jgi:hypothetical protein
MIRDDEWHAGLMSPDELDALVLGALTDVPREFYEIRAGLQDEDGNPPPRHIRDSLLRLQEAGKADVVYGEGWRLAPAEYPPMTRDYALGVLCDAARSWQNELEEYIIPADEDSEEGEAIDTTASRHEESRLIDEAIALLNKEEQ